MNNKCKCGGSQRVPFTIKRLMGPAVGNLVIQPSDVDELLGKQTCYD